MGALDMQLFNFHMVSEMVCMKERTHTGPALGFRSFDRLSRDDTMTALALMSYPCFDIQSSSIAPDATVPFDDSHSLSCLDMPNIHKIPEMQSFAFNVVDFKSTVLVAEDPLIIEEREHYIPMPSKHAIPLQPCNGVANETSWQSDNIYKHLQCSNDAGSEKLSVEVATHSDEVPSMDNFKDSLQKCRKISSFVDAKQLHLHLCQSGLEDHKDLGNFLVPMFVECGCMDIAQQVFKRLKYQNEHSWTSLVQGYVASEELEQALTLYQMMLHDFINPSDHTFVALLKACALIIDVERGKFIHSEVVMKGMEQNSFVGGALIDMYTKCGSLVDAGHTLKAMDVQDVVPWTSMISGYVEHGFTEEALICMKDMRKSGLSPDAFTISCCLKACADIGAMDEGHKLHVELIQKGFTGDVFAGIALMDMYTKCGALFEVKNVFERLCIQDRVSWTTMIMAYSDHECSQEAFNCLEAMQLEGVSPVAATFVCFLKACVSISAIENGRLLHCEIVKRGFEGDSLVHNTLVDMYAKCRSLLEAQQVLAKLPIHNPVPWTALIAAYLEQGDVQKVFECFEQVEMEGMPMDEALFVLSLKASGRLGVLDKGQERHISAVKFGFEEDIVIGNTLVGMYAKCGALCEARELFSKLSVRNVVSWNALLAGYSEFGPFDEAWKCFCQMQSDGVIMDAVTCACMLKACGNIRAMDKGQEVHGELAKKGYETDFLVASTLVDMYGKCGSLVEAQTMFEVLMVQDLVSWNALLQAYTSQKLHEEALSCFQQMQLNGISPDITSWSLMILCYMEQRDKACLLYARMLEQGLLANNVVFVSVLKACGDVASIETARRIHAQVCKVDGCESLDVTLTTAVIDIYGKCGSMCDAQQVFNALPTKVPAAWSALVRGYARQGNSELVFHLLLEMAKKVVQPDEGIFLGILSACSHAGLLSEGQKFFEIMCERYDIMPQLEHHTCMVDLFGRASHLDTVIKFVEKLPVEPDPAMWRSVMDACSKWGHKYLGIKAFKQAVSLDKRQAGSYISMANLYADIGKLQAD